MNAKHRWLLAGFLLLLAIPTVSRAQYRRGRERTIGGFDINDVSFDGVYPPNYRPSGIFRSVRGDRWLRLRVEYELGGNDDDWVDELTIEWAVAIMRDDRPLLLRTSVRYADVQGDEDHYAVVYVRPQILLRYYGSDRVSNSDLLVYIRFLIDGERAGEFRYNDDDAPGNWWEATEPAVTLRRDELLPRTQTPFAPLDGGAFEHIISPP